MRQKEKTRSTDRSSDEAIEQRICVELDRVVIRRLRVVSAGLGLVFVVWAILIAFTPLVHPPLSFPLAATTVAVYLLLTIALFRRSLAHYWVHPIGCVAAAMLLLNGLLQLHPLNAEDVMRIMVVPLGASLVFLSLRWLVVPLALSLAASSLVAWGTLSSDQLLLAGAVAVGGVLISVAVQGTRLVNHDRMLVRLAELAEDDRRKRELEEEKQRYELAVRGANDGLWYWDLTSDQLYLSPRWKSMLGYRDSEIGSDPEEWFSRLHAYYSSSVREDLNAHLHGEAPHFETKYRIRHRDGGYRWMLVRGLAVRNAEGKPIQIAGSQTDITTLIEVENRLIHDALHDPLTGLPNRSFLLRQLETIWERKQLFAVLFLDLDHFKTINDTLGHDAGDRLLVKTAERLRSCQRTGDVIARFGGDEFVVVLNGLRSLEDARKLAHNIQVCLESPVELKGKPVSSAASIGVALSGGSSSPEQLLSNADIAMYNAKLNRGKISVFDPEMKGRSLPLRESPSRTPRGDRAGGEQCA